MATKFFKKYEPNLGVNIGGTTAIKFKTLDGVIGYFATDDERIQTLFQGYITNQQYGMSEITWDEYDKEYLKKKATAQPLRKPWRDEFSPQTQSRSTNLGKKEGAAAVNGNGQSCSRIAMVDDEPTPAAVAAVAAVAEVLKVPFQPTTGKRTPTA